MKHRFQIRLIVFSLLLFPELAFAHGFAGSGWLHPLTGIDHMCAMVAVGAWSAQIGGKAIWRVPAAFVTAMLIGGIIGFEHFILPATEYGIVFSVFLLGVAIASECRFGVLLASLGVGIFGLCHGYAHGVEMPTQDNKFSYAIGFIITTAGLHLVGAIGGLLLLEEPKGRKTLRLLGACCTLVGVYLFYKLVR